MNSRDYRIRAVLYGTDGRYRTRDMTYCRQTLAARLKKLPGVEVAEWILDDLMKTMYWTAHNELATGPWCGFFSWKPYIIMREMMNVDDGDVIFYVDADVWWPDSWNMLTEFIGLAKERSIVLNRFSARNAQYTQRDTFILMGADFQRYWDSPHVIATMIAIERSNRTLRFVNDWLVASLSYDIVAGKPNEHGENFRDFIAHKREQSVLAILAERYDIALGPPGLQRFAQRACGARPPGYQGLSS